MNDTVQGQRSTFVNVVGWIFLVLSGLGVLMLLVQMLLFGTLFASPEIEKAMATAQASGEIAGVSLFLFQHIWWVLAASLLVLILVLVSSIGLLRRWNWARLCFVVLMILAALKKVVDIGMAAFMAPMFTSQMSNLPPDAPDLGGFVIGVVIFSVIISIGLMALYAWIAWRLTRPAIVAEFTA